MEWSLSPAVQLLFFALIFATWTRPDSPRARVSLSVAVLGTVFFGSQALNVGRAFGWCAGVVLPGDARTGLPLLAACFALWCAAFWVSDDAGVCIATAVALVQLLHCWSSRDHAAALRSSWNDTVNARWPPRRTAWARFVASLPVRITSRERWMVFAHSSHCRQLPRDLRRHLYDRYVRWPHRIVLVRGCPSRFHSPSAGLFHVHAQCDLALEVHEDAPATLFVLVGQTSCAVHTQTASRKLFASRSADGTLTMRVHHLELQIRPPVSSPALAEWEVLWRTWRNKRPKDASK